MPEEIEIKLRLTAAGARRLRERLRGCGAEFEGEEFEENVLYSGAAIDLHSSALRLRRTNRRGVLTFKQRTGATRGGVKRQREDETEVADADALARILDSLGLRPALVYEKRRATWRLMTEAGAVEVVVDELPFGAFAEIEGAEEAIHEARKTLSLTRAEVEHETYPRLVMKRGIEREGVIEARFNDESERG